MIHSRTNLSRRALTLVELLAALTILSVFVAAAAAWASGAARLSAHAASTTGARSALEQTEALLRRDLAERPVAPIGARPTPQPPQPPQPRLPFDPVVDAAARSITVVTASRAQGDALVGGDASGAGGGEFSSGGGGGGGWRTVSWRLDAARGELLRGSWEYDRGHAASIPAAQHDAPGVRVALRGLDANRGFELRRVEATVAEEGVVKRGPAPAPIEVWVAEITLQSGERASVVIGRAAADTSGGAR